MIILIICGGGDYPYNRDNYIETRLKRSINFFTLYFISFILVDKLICFAVYYEGTALYFTLTTTLCILKLFYTTGKPEHMFESGAGDKQQACSSMPAQKALLFGNSFLVICMKNSALVGDIDANMIEILQFSMSVGTLNCF